MIDHPSVAPTAAHYPAGKTSQRRIARQPNQGENLHARAPWPKAWYGGATYE